MRLNFYSRRRRLNKSLLGSHKNTLRSQKSATLQKQQHCLIINSQPLAINRDEIIYQVVSIIFLAELVHLAELEELEEIDF